MNNKHFYYPKSITKEMFQMRNLYAFASSNNLIQSMDFLFLEHRMKELKYIEATEDSTLQAKKITIANENKTAKANLKSLLFFILSYLFF